MLSSPITSNVHTITFVCPVMTSTEKRRWDFQVWLSASNRPVTLPTDDSLIRILRLSANDTFFVDSDTIPDALDANSAMADDMPALRPNCSLSNHDDNSDSIEMEVVGTGIQPPKTVPLTAENKLMHDMAPGVVDEDDEALDSSGYDDKTLSSHGASSNEADQQSSESDSKQTSPHPPVRPPFYLTDIHRLIMEYMSRIRLRLILPADPEDCGNASANNRLPHTTKERYIHVNEHLGLDDFKTWISEKYLHKPTNSTKIRCSPSLTVTSAFRIADIYNGSKYNLDDLSKTLAYVLCLAWTFMLYQASLCL